MYIEAPCQVVITFQIMVLNVLKSNVYIFIQVKIHMFILSFTTFLCIELIINVPFGGDGQKTPIYKVFTFLKNEGF